MLKSIIIDYLFLDTSVCGRCKDTETNLENAVHDASPILKELGYEIKLNKIHISTKELALEHKLLSSPTIRVNGRDIDESVNENECEECGSLCNDDADCRVFNYRGGQFLSPPKEMIIMAIFEELKSGDEVKDSKYYLPDNLDRFFRGKKSGCNCDGGC